jgi:phosphoribosylglycinamide formyltransferase-1
VRVAVLASGAGTILEAMTGHGVPIALVVADRACGALGVADRHGIETRLLDRRDWGGYGRAFDRPGYTGALTATLTEAGIDLVAMAGFGTILSEELQEAYGGRVLNTHPSLLPAFPGWHAVRDALAAGVAVTGCTVHLATLEVDAGPVLAQREVPVLAGDTEERLHERIKQVERRLYPETILAVMAELAAGRQPAAGVRR